MYVQDETTGQWVDTEASGSNGTTYDPMGSNGGEWGSVVSRALVRGFDRWLDSELPPRGQTSVGNAQVVGRPVPTRQLGTAGVAGVQVAGLPLGALLLGAAVLFLILRR